MCIQVYKLNETRKLKREINELGQEKLILERINEIIETKDEKNNEIFANMSHDLRTPVVTIKAYTDMLLEGKFGELSSVQKEKLTSIKKNTDALVTVILDLLVSIKKHNLE